MGANKRGSNTVAFIALNDGSTIHNIQAVAELASFDENIIKQITTGSCIQVTGKLVESMGKGQTVEIQAESIEILGLADPQKFPLQKKGHSMEFLREIPHLRPRTNYFGCVLRLRHAMAFAIHAYFNEKRFVYVHTQSYSADCEGAGEMFQVTTLIWKILLACQTCNRLSPRFSENQSLTVSGQLNGEMCAWH